MTSISCGLFCFEALENALSQGVRRSTVRPNTGNNTGRTLAEITQSWLNYLQHLAESTSSTHPSELTTLLQSSPSWTKDVLEKAQANSPRRNDPTLSDTELVLDYNQGLAEPILKTAASPLAYPLFVTWNQYERPSSSASSRERELRGCIGTFADQEINKGLRTYSLVAALEDTRFPPIQQKELPRLSVSVTLLANFEKCKDKFDWEVGRHGIRIYFHDPADPSPTHSAKEPESSDEDGYESSTLSATFLPDVAAEQGWTQSETLIHLMYKAGWRGPRKDWESVPLRVTRYEGLKVSVDYELYQSWKTWEGQKA